MHDDLYDVCSDVQEQVKDGDTVDDVVETDTKDLIPSTPTHFYTRKYSKHGKEKRDQNGTLVVSLPILFHTRDCIKQKLMIFLLKYINLEIIHPAK